MILLPAGRRDDRAFSLKMVWEGEIRKGRAVGLWRTPEAGGEKRWGRAGRAGSARAEAAASAYFPLPHAGWGWKAFPVSRGGVRTPQRCRSGRLPERARRVAHERCGPHLRAGGNGVRGSLRSTAACLRRRERRAHGGRGAYAAGLAVAGGNSAVSPGGAGVSGMEPEGTAHAGSACDFIFRPLRRRGRESLPGFFGRPCGTSELPFPHGRWREQRRAAGAGRGGSLRHGCRELVAGSAWRGSGRLCGSLPGGRLPRGERRRFETWQTSIWASSARGLSRVLSA